MTWSVPISAKTLIARALEVLADPRGRHDRLGADRVPRALVGAVLGQVQDPGDAGHRPGVLGSPVGQRGQLAVAGEGRLHRGLDALELLRGRPR